MDYQYDSYDCTTLKVAFQNLRKAEQQGFWVGLLAGIPIGTWLVSRKELQSKFTAGPISKAVSSLVIGSPSYGVWVFNARQSYNGIAAKVNRKYSIILNKAMTYG